MPQETTENLAPQETGETGAKQVPVAEAIKYRRRAQQAESQIQQLTEQLDQLRSDVAAGSEQLATAEAQRDEARAQLTVTENRLAVERLLSEAGVVDLEAASTLLSERIDVEEQLGPDAIAEGIEQLLVDKPFLRAASTAPLPPATASERPDRPTTTGQLASAAAKAAHTGDRKDVAEYLRLRRQAAIA